MDLDIRAEFICLNEVIPAAFLHITDEIDLFFTDRDPGKDLVRGLECVQVVCPIVRSFCCIQRRPNV